jgi:NADH dehydrogenase
MAVIGKNFAILEAGRLRTGGLLTWFLWVFIHVMALPQLQNRWRVQTQWLWSYLSGQRSSRLIAEPPSSTQAAVTAKQAERRDPQVGKVGDLSPAQSD